MQELPNTFELIFYRRCRNLSSSNFEVQVLSSGELLPKSSTGLLTELLITSYDFINLFMLLIFVVVAITVFNVSFHNITMQLKYITI